MKVQPVPPHDEAPSPCIKLCRIDHDAKYCAGCKRTIGEITRWTRMSIAQRKAVLAALPNRVL